jgi:hypothetical protein
MAPFHIAGIRDTFIPCLFPGKKNGSSGAGVSVSSYSINRCVENKHRHRLQITADIKKLSMAYQAVKKDEAPGGSHFGAARGIG